MPPKAKSPGIRESRKASATLRALVETYERQHIDSDAVGRLEALEKQLEAERQQMRQFLVAELDTPLPLEWFRSWAAPKTVFAWRLRGGAVPVNIQVINGRAMMTREDFFAALGYYGRAAA